MIKLENYILTGFSGAGKTTLLGMLETSASQDYECIDLDQYIFEKNFSSYPNLAAGINTVGIEVFREMERYSIQSLLEKKNLILALGGGALTKENFELIQQHQARVIYLEDTFESCYARIYLDEGRPLSKLSKEELLEIYQERQKVWGQIPVKNRIAGSLSEKLAQCLKIMHE